MILAPGRDRVHWLVIAALVAACNGVASPVFLAIESKGLVPALLNTFGLSPIFWFVMFIAAGIAFEEERESRLSRFDTGIVAAVLALAFIPIVSAGSAAVLLAGAWLTVSSAAGSRGRRAGIVLLALTTSLIWGHLFLAMLGDRIVSIDGRFVAWLAGTEAQGNLVGFSDGGKPMMIAYGCSSLHNLTMAIQFWVAITQLLRIPLGRGSLLVLAAAVVGNVLVNGVRLATIAHNRDQFDYWHTGGGGML
ncbi:MAG: archaeosortase/exosortase family protein, partial [Novosphingobium sp.]